jgi:hypothetical protein
MTHADPRLHEHEWRGSSNLMPLSRTDIVAMTIGVLGTVALIMIAAASAGGEHGSYGAVTITRVLIATGALLVNMAHLVGILFFESVDYHGPFQRLFSRLSIFGTSAAVIVSLAIGLL